MNTKKITIALVILLLAGVATINVYVANESTKSAISGLNILTLEALSDGEYGCDCDSEETVGLLRCYKSHDDEDGDGNSISCCHRSASPQDGCDFAYNETGCPTKEEVDNLPEKV
jgi:hypothetical protein